MANKKTSAKAEKKSRKIRKPNYKSFRFSKKIKHDKKLSSGFKIFRSSIGLMLKNWKLFLGIAAVYGFLVIVLSKGLTSVNLSELKENLQLLTEGGASNFTNSIGLFAYLIGTAGATKTAEGSVYQTLLLIIVSLATIWAFRQVNAGKKIRIRDAYYRGVYPLVVFFLVLLVIGLQLLPLLIGSWLYSVVITNAIAVTSIEKFLWLLIFILFTVLSLYMICSSIFALYISTLPDMTPMKALRSARQLVYGMRWVIMRKLLFLLTAVILIGAVIIMPLILFVTPVAEWVFFALTIFAPLVVNGYIYTLYRELL